MGVVGLAHAIHHGWEIALRYKLPQGRRHERWIVATPFPPPHLAKEIESLLDAGSTLATRLARTLKSFLAHRSDHVVWHLG